MGPSRNKRDEMSNQGLHVITVVGIVAGFDAALVAVGHKPFHLPSGAGHDTMVMGQICPAGMLFVRCKGGISHNPAESLTSEDCELALAALTRFVRDFRL